MIICALEIIYEIFLFKWKVASVHNELSHPIKGLDHKRWQICKIYVQSLKNICILLGQYEDDLKYEEDLKTEHDLKYEDNPNFEGNLKYEDNLTILVVLYC